MLNHVDKQRLLQLAVTRRLDATPPEKTPHYQGTPFTDVTEILGAPSAAQAVGTESSPESPSEFTQTPYADVVTGDNTKNVMRVPVPPAPEAEEMHTALPGDPNELHAPIEMLGEDGEKFLVPGKDEIMANLSIGDQFEREEPAVEEPIAEAVAPKRKKKAAKKKTKTKKSTARSRRSEQEQAE